MSMTGAWIQNIVVNTYISLTRRGRALHIHVCVVGQSAHRFKYVSSVNQKSPSPYYDPVPTTYRLKYGEQSSMKYFPKS